MKTVCRFLAGVALGALIAFSVPAGQAVAAQACDTLTCTPQGCCTINSETGDICDCEPWN